MRPKMQQDRLNQQLFQAAKNNDLELFTKIVKQGGNPEAIDSHGFKPSFYFILGNVSDSEYKEIKEMMQNNANILRILRK